MAPLTDPAILEQFREALREWNCEGFIEWKPIAGKITMAKAKPYPRHCSDCGAVAVQPAVIAYDAHIKHDEVLHQFRVPQLPVDRCEACGELFFTNRTDDYLYDEFRARLGLLQPTELRDALARLQMSPQEFGERLGVNVDLVSDWIEGLRVPSRAMDNLMRLFLTFPNVREALAAHSASGAPGNFAPSPRAQLTPAP